MQSGAPDYVELLDLSKIRWPNAGDRLFKEDKSSTANAEFNRDTFTRQQLMTNGYRTAGDVLIEHALNNRFYLSSLVYPIIFSYRHYLELILKGMVAYYGRFFGVPSPKTNHDLKVLLRSYRRLMIKSHGSSLATDDVIVSKCILEYHSFDPTSFAFRYHVDRKSRELYPISVEAVDLVRLKGTMCALANYFNGTDAFLFHLIQAVPQSEI